MSDAARAAHKELPSGVRTITGVATSITLFVGWAPRGPIDQALRLTSFADFERAYSGLNSRAVLGHAVRHFYDNGGAQAYGERQPRDGPRALHPAHPGHRQDRRCWATAPPAGSRLPAQDCRRRGTR